MRDSWKPYRYQQWLQGTDQPVPAEEAEVPAAQSSKQPPCFRLLTFLSLALLPPTMFVSPHHPISKFPFIHKKSRANFCCLRPRVLPDTICIIIAAIYWVFSECGYCTSYGMTIATLVWITKRNSFWVKKFEKVSPSGRWVTKDAPSSMPTQPRMETQGLAAGHKLGPFGHEQPARSYLGALM